MKMKPTSGADTKSSKRQAPEPPQDMSAVFQPLIEATSNMKDMAVVPEYTSKSNYDPKSKPSTSSGKPACPRVLITVHGGTAVMHGNMTNLTVNQFVGMSPSDKSSMFDPTSRENLVNMADAFKTTVEADQVFHHSQSSTYPNTPDHMTDLRAGISRGFCNIILLALTLSSITLLIAYFCTVFRFPSEEPLLLSSATQHDISFNNLPPQSDHLPLYPVNPVSPESKDVKYADPPPSTPLTFTTTSSFEPPEDIVIPTRGSIILSFLWHQKTSDFVQPNEVTTTSVGSGRSPSTTNIPQEISDFQDYDKDSLQILSQAAWDAKPPTRAIDLNLLPVHQVILCETKTEECSSPTTCIPLVQMIQQYYMVRDFQNIAYNFLIGGDGSVYEGRGWDLQGELLDYKNLDSLGVALIGSFEEDIPSAVQIDTFNALIEFGITLKKISPDYKLVAKCQLDHTYEQGFALIKNITSWPNFDDSLPTIECFINSTKL